MKPISLLVVFFYFLPFVFFVFGCGNFAYNPEEAAANEANEKAKRTTTVVPDSSEAFPNDSADNLRDVDTSGFSLAIQTGDPLIPENLQEIRPKDGFWYNVLKKAVFPTTTSLSGVGCIFYFKNLAGQIMISVSILMALIVAVIVWFKKTRPFGKFFIFVNLTCLTGFITNCFYSDVTVQFGIWLLLATLVLQIWLSLKTAPNKVTFQSLPKL